MTPALPTLDDVIRRSVSMHPSLLADAMRNVAQIHRNAAATYIDGPHLNAAKKIALDRAHECEETAQWISSDPDAIDPSIWALSRRIMTFAQAAKLQCLPFSIQAEIAKADDDRRRA